jgi:uncharacterized membrane protein YbaN (DUF454 family)
MDDDLDRRDEIPQEEQAKAVTRRAGYFSRPLFLILGWLMVGLGAVGVVIPGLPTVPFLLLALWAFSKSSEKFHDWLYNHPSLGPPLRDWREHGAIPRRAKILAVATMTVSFLWITFGIAEDWVLPTIVAGCLIPVAIFICTRPSRPSS